MLTFFIRSYSRTFRMVLGFSGSSTIPTIVGHTLSKFVSARAVDGLDPEEAVRNCIVNDVTLLKSSSVVYIVPGPEASSRPVATQVGHHHPPDRVWGVDFEGCADENCIWSPSDTSWASNEPFERARPHCLRCQKKGNIIIREIDLPSIKPWGTSHPRVFKSVFPLPECELQIVQNVPYRTEKELQGLKRKYNRTQL